MSHTLTVVPSAKPALRFEEVARLTLLKRLLRSAAAADHSRLQAALDAALAREGTDRTAWEMEVSFLYEVMLEAAEPAARPV